MSRAQTSAASQAFGMTAGRIVSVLAAAAAVALSAQIVIPMPLSPVPFTLQGLAVVVVGGVLGPRLGAAALLAYLAAGLAGLPVFAGGGSGVARLLGPTGGYLLAFPVAAALTGAIAARGGFWRVLAGAAAGMAAIFAGGAMQLTLLTGDPAVAAGVGVLPFLLVDGVKVVLAALLVLGLRPGRRASR